MPRRKHFSIEVTRDVTYKTEHRVLATDEDEAVAVAIERDRLQPLDGGKLFNVWRKAAIFASPRKQDGT